MERGIGRIFLFAFIGFLLFIFIVVKLVHNPKPKPAPSPTAPVVKILPEYSDTLAEVSYSTDGHINGDDQHRGIIITVDRFERKIQITAGYNGNVIEEHTFANTETAYNVFLHALQNSGFTAKSKKATTANETGQCPTGLRFNYELNDSGDVLSDLWSTSCGTGTMGGRTSIIQSLFQAQITDYSKIISNSKVQL
jgi:hypothetical protein